MKMVMIKYNIQIPEDRLDKYCKKMRIGRNEATKGFKDVAETYGRTAVYDVIEERINS